MSPRREYFDEPVVRVETLKARFPKTCPVCGSPAANIVRMRVATSGSKSFRRMRDYTIYSPYGRRGHSPHTPEMKVLPVQVCDDHEDPDAGTDRFQTLCIVVDGLLLGFLFFGLLFLGDRISRGQSLTLWPFLFIGLFVIAMGLTAIAFMPNALARAVRIVGFDAGMQHVMIAFKSAAYRDEFMQENQMTAELVSWIMKADD
ncbi:MAG: hypothetical protein RTV41_11335 [Candidatus Thorarchaeota archaeon]